MFHSWRCSCAKSPEGRCGEEHIRVSWFCWEYGTPWLFYHRRTSSPVEEYPLNQIRDNQYLLENMVLPVYIIYVYIYIYVCMYMIYQYIFYITYLFGIIWNHLYVFPYPCLCNPYSGKRKFCNSRHHSQRFTIHWLVIHGSIKLHHYIVWLVVSTPLKNISQLGLLFPIYGKIENGNQTTNQL